MRQRHEYKQLATVIDRIESYDVIDLPSDCEQHLKVSAIPQSLLTDHSHSVTDRQTDGQTTVMPIQTTRYGH